MCAVYGDNYFTRTPICVWCKKFGYGREIVVDEEEPGRRVVFTINAMNAAVDSLMQSQAV